MQEQSTPHFLNFINQGYSIEFIIAAFKTSNSLASSVKKDGEIEMPFRLSRYKEFDTKEWSATILLKVQGSFFITCHASISTASLSTFCYSIWWGGDWNNKKENIKMNGQHYQKSKSSMYRSCFLETSLWRWTWRNWLFETSSLSRYKPENE